MLRAWLQPPEPMWKLFKLEKGSRGGGGGREERRKGVGDGLLRAASCQPGNLANSWGRAVCENFLPLPLPQVPGLDNRALGCFENPPRERQPLRLLRLSG